MYLDLDLNWLLLDWSFDRRFPVVIGALGAFYSHLMNELHNWVLRVLHYCVEFPSRVKSSSEIIRRSDSILTFMSNRVGEVLAHKALVSLVPVWRAIMTLID